MKRFRFQAHVSDVKSGRELEPSYVLPDDENGPENVLRRKSVETQRNDVELVVRPGQTDVGQRLDFRFKKYGLVDDMVSFHYKFYKKSFKNKHGEHGSVISIIIAIIV